MNWAGPDPVSAGALLKGAANNAEPLSSRFPDASTSHVSFDIEKETVFIEDANNGYKRCKKYLIQKACEIALQDYDSECYLFLKHNTRIPPNDFIRIEEQP